MVHACLSFSGTPGVLLPSWKERHTIFPLLQLKKLTSQEFITEPHVLLKHCGSVILFLILCVGIFLLSSSCSSLNRGCSSRSSPNGSSSSNSGDGAADSSCGREVAAAHRMQRAVVQCGCWLRDCNLWKGRNLGHFIEIRSLVFLANWSLAVRCRKTLHALMKLWFSAKKELMIIRIPIKSTCNTAEAPRIDNPDKRGIVLVTEVARESNLLEHITIIDLPASSVWQPTDYVHKIGVNQHHSHFRRKFLGLKACWRDLLVTRICIKCFEGN
mmetsp:Transcript_8742/g.14906  ORF Transcript_8742/g.14906 Transcript_8742/m.14906 type:complete len:271 (+) Transcript_8742:389-1201(+)